MASKLIPVTNNESANRLLCESPLALLIGMLLDQQVPMEWAFLGPLTLQDRLGGRLEADAIAAMDPDDFLQVCLTKPAIHRFPAAMAGRIQAVCQAVVDDYDGDAAQIWKGVRTGDALYARLRALPGYGDEKSKIFMAILAKRFGVRPRGWQETAAPFGDDNPRSVADISSRERFDEVRAWKKMMKAKGKGKTD